MNHRPWGTHTLNKRHYGIQTLWTIDTERHRCYEPQTLWYTDTVDHGRCGTQILWSIKRRELDKGRGCVLKGESIKQQRWIKLFDLPVFERSQFTSLAALLSFVPLHSPIKKNVFIKAEVSSGKLSGFNGEWATFKQLTRKQPATND